MSCLYDDTKRQEAINRFFNYAKNHRDSLVNYQTVNEAQTAMDYFLLMLTATVENIRSALPTYGSKKYSLLNAPSSDTVKAIPELQAVYWAWEARHSTAHNYMLKLEQTTHELEFDGGILYVNGSPLELTLLTLQPVRDKDGNHIIIPECYEHKPGDLADFLISFWEKTYCYILENPRKKDVYSERDRYTYKELWKYYNS
ncbi:MAG: hypothetical protein PHD12_06315 [Methylotenera sp.]|nr:hypothetical protein [Methylotenera sp.]